MTRAHARLVDPDLPTAQRSLADEWVYRYTTRDGLLKWFLPNCELRMNAWSAMNDPRETKSWCVTGSWTTSGSMTSVDVRSRIDEIARRSARLLSATRDRQPEPDENRGLLFHRGWANAPMWNHYADEYAGACLVFDLAELNANLGELKLGAGHRHGMGWVEYRDRPAEIELSANFASVTDVDRAMDEYLDRHRALLPLHFAKSTDWRYEQEARLFSIALELAPSEFDQPLAGLPARNALRAVVLGDAHERPADTSAHLRARLGRDFEVFQCQWISGRPLLQPL